jgi:protein TonB
MTEHVMDDRALQPQRFGWPVALAVAVHAAILIGPALDLRTSRLAPEEPLVQVELIETPSTPETPVPVVQPPVPSLSRQAPPVEPVTTTMVEAPKVPAQAVPPPRVEAEPSPPAGPEPVVVASHLSVNTAPVPIHRSLNAVATGLKRALRDPTAEFSAIRTEARLGDHSRPEYPRAAREAGWEGTVMLRVEVLENGMPGTVLVHKTCGHDVLDSAALSAAQKWKFVPAMDGAFAVRSVVFLPVQFDLRAER